VSSRLPLTGLGDDRVESPLEVSLADQIPSDPLKFISGVAESPACLNRQSETETGRVIPVRLWRANLTRDCHTPDL
jgi:hypothetical protein